MPAIDLHYVDELILVRQLLHGGGRGAPPIQAGHRIGASVNRSCVVILSALLQAHVEDVFKEAAQRVFTTFRADPTAFDAYWKQMNRWGNPSDGNIKSLFLKLGVADILANLSWQGLTNTELRKKLSALNQIRNRIAHGAPTLAVNGQPYSLTLAKVVAFRDFANNFGNRFSAHVTRLIP